MIISYDDVDENSQENDFIYLVNTESERNVLKVFDLKDYIETERIFELYSLDFYIPYSMTITINKQIYCFGKGLSFILDVESPNIKAILKEWSENCHLSSITYLNNCVYIFSLNQERSNSYKMIEKYDLASHKWTTISKIRISSFKFKEFYCLTFKHNILMYNYTPIIFQYDESINSYSIILEMLRSLTKIIISGTSRLYIIESKGRIYESDVENQYAFKSIGESNADFIYVQFSLANYQGSAYFGLITRNYAQRTHTYSYYRFSLKDKTVMKINHKKWNCHII